MDVVADDVEEDEILKDLKDEVGVVGVAGEENGMGDRGIVSIAESNNYEAII